MIPCGAPPSNQPGLEGAGLPGEELMAQAREWAASHPEQWAWYLGEARRESARGDVSPNWMVNLMRHTFHVSVPNAYAPCLARIALEDEPGLRLRLARSVADGYTTADLSGRGRA